MQAFEQSFAINSMEYYGAPAESDSNYLLETFHQYPHGDFRPTFYNPFEIKHRRRTSRAQLKVLEKSFSENPKPNATVRRILAQKLDMTPRGVQIWFQNRRAKAKLQRRKASAAVAEQQQQQQQSSSDIHAASSTSSSSSTSTSSTSPASTNTTTANSVNTHNHTNNASSTNANGTSEQPVLFSQFFANVQPRADRHTGKPAFTTYLPPSGNNTKQHATTLPWQTQEQDQEQIRSAAAVVTAAAAVAAASSPSCSLVLSEPFTATDNSIAHNNNWLSSQSVHPLAHIDDSTLGKDDNNLFATEQFLSQPWTPPCGIVNECKPRCLSEPELQYGSSNVTWNCNAFRRGWSFDASAMCSPLPDQYSMDLYSLQGMPFDCQAPMQQQQHQQQQQQQQQQQLSPPLMSSCSASTISATSVTGSPILLDGYYDPSSFNYGLDQQQTSCSSTDALIASALA